VDELGCERIIDPSPQAPDVDVDDVGVAVKIHIPDLL
jgi:hypothetical protein